MSLVKSDVFRETYSTPECLCRHMEKKFVVYSAHSVYSERCSFSSHWSDGNFGLLSFLQRISTTYESRLYLLSLRIYEEVEINMRNEEALLNREGFYKGYKECFGIIRSVSGRWPACSAICFRSIHSCPGMGHNQWRIESVDI